jgi:hypothetical protein
MTIAMEQRQVGAGDAQRKARQRADDRDLIIPDPEDIDRRLRLAENDAAWLRFYLDRVFYNPFTADQLETIAECGECLRYGLKRAKAAPRGDGKSSIVKYLGLKYALNRQVRFPLVVAATYGKAVKTTKSLRKQLANRQDTRLSADYPLECLVARRVDPWPSRARNVTANGGRSIHVEWGADFFTLPVWEDEEPIGPIIMSLGYTSDELQGCNIYDIRPDFVMLDDLDSRDSLASEDGVVAGKIEEAVEKTIAGLGGQSRQLGQYMLCTITSREAAAYKYTDPEQKPAWSGRRVAAISTWPTNIGLWDQYISKRQKGMQQRGEDGTPIDRYGRQSHEFYLANYEEMNAGAVLSNPFNFESDLLPDGSQKQVSSLQRCMDFIADHSREAFDTEHQNDPPEGSTPLAPKLTWLHVSDAAGDFARMQVDPSTTAVVRAVDVRKVELHDATLASDALTKYRIADYAVRRHGTGETTVEQAESLILDALRALAMEWDASPPIDGNGTEHPAGLVLIDKGWMGNWTEDGEVKTWAAQPVETFCVERGVDSYLPAKGDGSYRSPAPDRAVIIGNHWHINRGKGKNRICDEVIWDADYWHLLVEGLFLLPEGTQDRFELFNVDGYDHLSVYTNHKAFGGHIEAGAKELKAQMARGTRSRKPRWVRDHWWDSLAMCLVGLSIVEHRTQRRARQKPRVPLSEMGKR